MKKIIWGIAASWILATGSSAFAQFPGSTPIFPPQYQPSMGGTVPPNVQQNIYNRGTQPLSPYLNLLRGQGNPGADYYFGVRPGTPNGGQQLNQQVQRGGALNNSQMRQGYLPQASIQSAEPLPLPDPNQDIILPPSGHGVAYGNVFGISNTGVPGMNTASARGGFFKAPSSGTVPRPSTNGLPATRRP